MARQDAAVMARSLIGARAIARRLYGLDRRHPSSALHQHVRARPVGAVAMPSYQDASAEEVLPALQATTATRAVARMRRWSEFTTKGGSK